MYQPTTATQQKCLLLVDNYRPHITDESRKIVTEECQSDYILIPAGCTPLVQPMDVSTNCPFTACMDGRVVGKLVQ